MKNDLNYSENSKYKLSTVYCGERRKRGLFSYLVMSKKICEKNESHSEKADSFFLYVTPEFGVMKLQPLPNACPLKIQGVSY